MSGSIFIDVLFFFSNLKEVLFLHCLVIIFCFSNSGNVSIDNLKGSKVGERLFFSKFASKILRLRWMNVSNIHSIFTIFYTTLPFPVRWGGEGNILRGKCPLCPGPCVDWPPCVLNSSSQYVISNVIQVSVFTLQ